MRKPRRLSDKHGKAMRNARDGVDHVATPAGERKYGKRIGEPIMRTPPKAKKPATSNKPKRRTAPVMRSPARARVAERDPEPVPVELDGPSEVAPRSEPAVETPRDLDRDRVECLAAAKEFTDRTGIPTDGFGRLGLDPRLARPALEGIADMVTAHPHVAIPRVVIRPLGKKDVVAQTPADRDESGVWHTREIAFDGVELSDLEIQADGMQSGQQDGWLQEAAVRDPGRFLAVHEFGHAMDHQGQHRARENFEQIAAEAHATDGSSLPLDSWKREMSSGYGQRDAAEALAEAFVDVELNGSEATPLSRAVYSELMNESER